MKDAADRARVQQLLTELKKDPANGIREVWTSADLAAQGSHPDAAFGVDVVDGFYTGGGHDVLVKASGSKGGHGFDPDAPGPALVVHPGRPGRPAARLGRRDQDDADRADAGIDSRSRPVAVGGEAVDVVDGHRDQRAAAPVTPRVQLRSVKLGSILATVRAGPIAVSTAVVSRISSAPANVAAS